MIGNILTTIVCAFLVLAIMTPTKNYFTIMVGLFVFYVILDFGIMKKKKKRVPFSLEINRNLWYGIGIFFFNEHRKGKMRKIIINFRSLLER